MFVLATFEGFWVGLVVGYLGYGITAWLISWQERARARERAARATRPVCGLEFGKSTTRITIRRPAGSRAGREE